jgi:hypothetical protein
VNLFTCLDQAAVRFGERGAVYHGERQLHTWAELADRALRLAASLREAVRPGARIAIASENRPEIIELMFATWAADGVVVPLNYKLHPREMAQIISDAGTTCRVPRSTYGGMYSPDPCDIGAPWIRLQSASGSSRSARCATVIAIRLRWVSIAPFERPVVPLV